MPPKNMLPSVKVTTQLVVGLGLAIAVSLAQDAAVIELLPGWLKVVAVPVLAAVVAYIKSETNPARSSGGA